MNCHPLVWVVTSFLAGILLDAWATWPIPVLAGVAFLFWGAAGWFLLSRRSTLIGALLFLISVFWIGGLWHACRCRNLPSNNIGFLPKSCDGFFVCVRGRIDGVPEFSPRHALPWLRENLHVPDLPRFVFPLSVQAIGGSSLNDACGRMRVIVHEGNDCAKNDPPFRRGDVVEIVGKLLIPCGPTHPGGFDYRRWMRRQNLDATLIVERWDAVRLLERPRFPPFLAWIDALRLHLRKVILTAFGKEAGASRFYTGQLLSALLLGWRKDLPPDLWDAYRYTGTAYFLAISGLHVGVVFAAVAFAVRAFWIDRRHALIVAMGVSVLYAFLSGGNPPVIRATVMACAFSLAYVLRRQFEIWGSLAFAALSICIWRPEEILRTGFQLSFLAVIAIVKLWPGLNALAKSVTSSRWDKIATLSLGQKITVWIKRSFVSSILVSLAAWVGTLPVRAVRFHMMTPVSIVLNPFVFVGIFLLLACGFTWLAVGRFIPQFSTFLMKGCDLGAWMSQGVISLFAANHWLCVIVGPLSVAARAGLILLLIAAMWWKDFRPGKRRFASACVLVVALFLWPSWAKTFEPRLSLTVLDVGEGLCTLVQTPNGSSVLYDCGSRSMYRDVGTEAAETLWAHGIPRFARCVLSHSHLDHCSGLPRCMELAGNGVLLRHRCATSNYTGKALWRTLHRCVIFRELKPGDVIKNLGCRVTALGITRNVPSSELNDVCIALLLSYRGRSILLTGDLNGEGAFLVAKQLKKRGTRLDVLQVPHHGHFDAGTIALIRATHPRVAVTSGYEDNVDPQVSASLREVGARHLITGGDGAIRVTIDKSGTLAWFRWNESDWQPLGRIDGRATPTPERESPNDSRRSDTRSGHASWPGCFQSTDAGVVL